MLSQLSRACKFGGDFKAAYTHAQAALRIQEEIYAPDDLRIARARVDLATGAVRTGDWETARQQAKAAKDRLRNLTPTEEEQAHVDLNNLAWVYNSLGETEGALELLLRSLAINEQAYGKAHPEVAKTLMNLGAHCLDEGNPTTAQTHLQRALEIFRAYYDEPPKGAKHPSGARTLPQSLSLLLNRPRYRSNPCTGGDPYHICWRSSIRGTITPPSSIYTAFALPVADRVLPVRPFDLQVSRLALPVGCETGISVSGGRLR